MQIDHHHKQTRVAFLKRTNRLKEADVWFPLTIKEEWVTLNPNTLYIWDFVSVTSSDFAAIVTCHDDLWNVSGRQSWAKILLNWGLEIVPKTEKHNAMQWVIFLGSGSTKPVSLFARGESGVRVPSWFVLPTIRDPDGFKFLKPQQHATCKKRDHGLLEHIEAAVSPRPRVQSDMDRSVTPSTPTTTETTMLPSPPQPAAAPPAPELTGTGRQKFFRLRAQRFVQRCHLLMRQERRCVPKNVAVPLQVKRVNLLRFHMGRFR